MKLNEPMEFTATIEDADLDKLHDVLKDINVNECPWFEVRDKHGNKARYYREPHWIPCSEMEPKKSGRYLCTHGGTGIVGPDYYTTQEQAEELFADPEDEYIGWASKNVIAWRELPEPYHKESEG